MKKKTRKLNKINIVLIFTFVLITMLGISYAFFTANLSGQEDETTITVTGGTMDINFAGGSKVSVSNIYPKTAAVATKTFTVAGNNTTQLNMAYKLTLQVQTNNFTANALKWRLTSTNTGANGTVVPPKSTDQNIPTGPSSIVLGTGSFTAPTNGSKVHTYGLSLYFPDTGGDQNADQGKSFTAFIKIENA